MGEGGRELVRKGDVGLETSSPQSLQMTGPDILYIHHTSLDDIGTQERHPPGPTAAERGSDMDRLHRLEVGVAYSVGLFYCLGEGPILGDLNFPLHRLPCLRMAGKQPEL